MKARKLDENGDWTFGNGLSSYVRDQAAVAQSIQTRVSSWMNDCFFAMTDGVDYRSLLEKGQQQALVNAVKLVILQTNGVVRVNSVTADLDADRKLTTRWNVDTIYSQNVPGATTN